jgi:hypothetical protein
MALKNPGHTLITGARGGDPLLSTLKRPPAKASVFRGIDCVPLASMTPGTFRIRRRRSA